MTNIKITSHKADIEKATQEAIEAVLELCGQAAEGYAQEYSEPRDTGNLVNKISHKVADDENAVFIGTNEEYAPYLEYGTGIYAFEGGGRKTPWAYKDKEGKWHNTRGIKPRHFLKRALTNHKEEYRKIIELGLKDVPNKIK